jgi:hypothetical protein
MSYLGSSDVRCVGTDGSSPDAGEDVRPSELPNVEQPERLHQVEQQLAALTLATQEMKAAQPQASSTTSAATFLPDIPAQSTSHDDNASFRPTPLASHPSLFAHGIGVAMSERLTLTIPVPLIDHKEPFFTMRHWDTWHDQVTDRIYKNAQGTYAAISTLMRNEVNVQTWATGSPQLMLFQRVVMSDLLLNHPPTHQKDGDLWEEFKNHFRHCLDVTAEKEERNLHGLIYSRLLSLGV